MHSFLDLLGPWFEKNWILESKFHPSSLRNVNLDPLTKVLVGVRVQMGSFLLRFELDENVPSQQSHGLSV